MSVLLDLRGDLLSTAQLCYKVRLQGFEKSRIPEITVAYEPEGGGRISIDGVSNANVPKYGTTSIHSQCAQLSMAAAHQTHFDFFANL